MEHKIKKWDIIEIREPNKEDIPKNILYIKNKYWMEIMSKKTTTRLNLHFNISIKTLGLKAVIESRYLHRGMSIWGIRAKSKKDQAIINSGSNGICYIPEFLLSYTGKRVLDTRELNSAASTQFHINLREKMHLGSLYSKIKSPGGIAMGDFRKYEQVFFPEKRMTTKKVLYEMIRYINYDGVRWHNLFCSYCGWVIPLHILVSSKYFRKDGSMTCKCNGCGKTNFVSLGYGGDKIPRVHLTSVKQ